MPYEKECYHSAIIVQSEPRERVFTEDCWHDPLRLISYAKEKLNGKFLTRRFYGSMLERKNKPQTRSNIDFD